MSNTTQHVVRATDGGWVVRKGGSSKATKHFDTQVEAIAWGREVAKNQNAEFYVHDRDGIVREKSSYVEEPHPPKS